MRPVPLDPPASRNHFRVKSNVVATDETGPFAVYNSLDDLPEEVEPRNPVLFRDLSVEQVATYFHPLLPDGLRLRAGDEGRFLICFWKHNDYQPRYLLPDGTGSAVGKHQAEWLHHAFALFKSSEQANEWVDQSCQAMGDWFAYSICEVVQVEEGISLERRRTNYLHGYSEPV